MAQLIHGLVDIIFTGSYFLFAASSAFLQSSVNFYPQFIMFAVVRDLCFLITFCVMF